jgi:hypothetical protein
MPTEQGVALITSAEHSTAHGGGTLQKLPQH